MATEAPLIEQKAMISTLQSIETIQAAAKPDASRCESTVYGIIQRLFSILVLFDIVPYILALNKATHKVDMGSAFANEHDYTTSEDLLKPELVTAMDECWKDNKKTTLDLLNLVPNLEAACRFASRVLRALLPVGSFLYHIAVEQAEIDIIITLSRMLTPLQAVGITSLSTALMYYTRSTYKRGGDVRKYIQQMGDFRKSANKNRKRNKKFDDEEHIGFIIAGILVPHPELRAEFDTIGAYAKSLVQKNGMIFGPQLQTVHERITSIMALRYPEAHDAHAPGQGHDSATDLPVLSSVPHDKQAYYTDASAMAAEASRLTVSAACQICGKLGHTAKNCYQLMSFATKAAPTDNSKAKGALKSGSGEERRPAPTTWNDNMRLCRGKIVDLATGVTTYCKDLASTGHGQHLDKNCKLKTVEKHSNLVMTWAEGDSDTITHVQHGLADVQAVESSVAASSATASAVSSASSRPDNTAQMLAIMVLFFAMIFMLPGLLAVSSPVTVSANLMVAEPVSAYDVPFADGPYPAYGVAMRHTYTLQNYHHWHQDFNAGSSFPLRFEKSSSLCSPAPLECVRAYVLGTTTAVLAAVLCMLLARSLIRAGVLMICVSPVASTSDVSAFGVTAEAVGSHVPMVLSSSTSWYLQLVLFMMIVAGSLFVLIRPLLHNVDFRAVLQSATTIGQAVLSPGAGHIARARDHEHGTVHDPDTWFVLKLGVHLRGMFCLCASIFFSRMLTKCFPHALWPSDFNFHILFYVTYTYYQSCNVTCDRFRRALMPRPRPRWTTSHTEQTCLVCVLFLLAAFVPSYGQSGAATALVGIAIQYVYSKRASLLSRATSPTALALLVMIALVAMASVSGSSSDFTEAYSDDHFTGTDPGFVPPKTAKDLTDTTHHNSTLPTVSHWVQGPTRSGTNVDDRLTHSASAGATVAAPVNATLLRASLP
jgi:hypothetical protein